MNLYAIYLKKELKDIIINNDMLILIGPGNRPKIEFPDYKHEKH